MEATNYEQLYISQGAQGENQGKKPDSEKA